MVEMTSPKSVKSAVVSGSSNSNVVSDRPMRFDAGNIYVVATAEALNFGIHSDPEVLDSTLSVE